MPSIKDFFKGLAAKGNFDITAHAAFFDALPDTDVPAEVQSGIDNSLISLKDAKNNHPEIKKHYHRQALDGVDQQINTLFEEMGVPEEDRAGILAETSSYKRIPMLVQKVAALKSAKNGAGSEDKKAIQAEIDKLQSEIRTAKAEKDKVAADYEKKLSEYKAESKLENLLSSHKTIFDDLDIDVRNTSVKNIINKNLQDNQAQFGFDDKGNFTLIKNDGSNYYGENHQQVTPAQFVEQSLAKAKILKVSSGQPATPSQNGTQPPPTGNGSSENKGQAAVKSLNDRAIADLAAAAQTSSL